MDACLDAVAVDARTGTSASFRAIGIHPPSLRLLDAIGVDDQIRDAGVHNSRGVARPDGIVESFLLPGGVRRWVVHEGAHGSSTVRRLSPDGPQARRKRTCCWAGRPLGCFSGAECCLRR
ncbi:hypothetical protein [Mycetocola sp.]|uniref:hypothetical protein n=1 Tax=Mycetocola sp. TaxID=1871042 RepID=UPI00345BCB80